MDKYIDETGRKQLSKWSDEGKSALQSYSGLWYSTFNEAMRGSSESELSPPLRKQLDAIQKGLNEASYPDSIVAYRGIHGKDAAEFCASIGVKDPSKAVGGIFTDKAFNSTSIDKSVADKFSPENILLEINIPKGSKAVALGGGSLLTDEREILIQRGARYEVTGYQKYEKGYTWQVSLIGTD